MLISGLWDTNRSRDEEAFVVETKSRYVLILTYKYAQNK
jgi:hypothetical protein